MDVNKTTTINNAPEYLDRRLPSHRIKQKIQQQPGYIPTIGEKSILSTIENVNKKMLTVNKEIRILVHDETKRIYMKVVDKETNKVIKEYPPEEFLDMFAKMLELTGLLVDERV